ncbi:MAG: hypothetical protein ACRERR_00025 [Moraxellaceae bacterium]
MFARKLPVLFCVVLFSTSALADGFKLVSRDGRQAEYEGSLSLSGRFERRQDAETLDWRGDRVCFFPEAQAVGLLPRDGGKKGAWFCFSNHSAATQQLRVAATQPGSCGAGGTATVAISHYVAETGVGETIDQAWLEKVVQQGPVTPIRCN